MKNDALQNAFNALPDPPPPDELWPSLARRRKRDQVWQRTRATVGVLVLAGLSSALILPWAASDPEQRDNVRQDSAVATIPPPPASSAVAAIDQALQNAYARGASDEEVAPLWEARRQLIPEGQAAPSASRS